MKAIIKICLVCSVLALCGFVVSGCGDSGPYAKFAGNWEREDDYWIYRIAYDFNKNSATMRTVRKTSKSVEMKQLFFTAEGKENIVAVTTSTEETMLLELQKNEKLRVKVYGGQHALESLFPKDPIAAALSRKTIVPETTLVFSHPKKENDTFFSKDTISYESLSGKWTTAESSSPVLDFDAKTKKLTLLDERYREILNTDVAMVSHYTESVDKNNKYHTAIIHFENAQAEQKKCEVFMQVNLSLSPTEATFIVTPVSYGKIVFKSDTLVPKMSTAERAKWVAARKKADEKKAAEEKQLLEEKAEKERQLLAAKYEAKAKMPPFSFGGFTLSDSPQKVIEKALGKYEISTSFQVQQMEDTVKIEKRRQNFGSINVDSDSLDEFFTYHQRANQFVHEYNLKVPDRIIEAGLKIDSISLEEKGKSGTGVTYFYYTLPGGEPKALYMGITGAIVREVPSVFQERYGEHEHIQTSRIWISNIEAAMTRIDINYCVLYMVSKANYDEYAKYVAAITSKLQNEEIAKRKTEQDALKSKI